MNDVIPCLLIIYVSLSSYLSIIPIESFADLDKNEQRNLSEVSEPCYWKDFLPTQTCIKEPNE